MEIQERYEIRRKLGQGGVGAVYEGYDNQLRRKVAVKRLQAEEDDMESQEAVDELLKECHSLSALNSPNIVSLFDFGQDSDGPFVVMELLEGETLESLIKKAPFTEQDFLTIAEQSLEGILAAHEAHILHRDLKPCNFMITWLPSGRMQVKVLDFGLAKFSIEPSKQTITHGASLFGSIYFMAPEQFEQLPLDQRTDLYSLGAVFYYGLTGSYPFDGDSVAQVMAGHLTGRCKNLKEYRPDLDPNLCNWVMSLMSRQPGNRPDSCAQALEQFYGVQKGTYTVPDPDAASVISATGPVNLSSPPARPGVLPGGTGPITPGSGPVPIGPTSNTPSGQIPVPGTGAYPVLSTGEKEGLPKPLLYAIAGGVVLIVVLIVMFSGPSDDGGNSGNSAGGNADEQNEEEVLPLPIGPELRCMLQLPENVIDLLTRRDTDGNGELSIDEFARFSTNSKSEAKLRKYFPLLDFNKDGSLSSSELNRAYRSRG